MPVLLVALLLPVMIFAQAPRWVQVAIVGAILWLAVTWYRRRAERAALYIAEVQAFGWRDDISPTEFEERCAVVMRLAGWDATTTKGSGDQGIDVVARKAGRVVVLQCKLYSRPVGNKAVQEVIAGRLFAGAHHAAVVSNAGYTPSAHALAGRTGTHLLHYVDLQQADALFR